MTTHAHTPPPSDLPGLLDGSITTVRIEMEVQPVLDGDDILHWHGYWWHSSEHVNPNMHMDSPFTPGDSLAVLEDYKYVERRESDKVLKSDESMDHMKIGFGKLCERLSHEGEDYLVYMADGVSRSFGEWEYHHPIYEHCIGIFDKDMPASTMPHWASRLTLPIISSRPVESDGVWYLDVEVGRKETE